MLRAKVSVSEKVLAACFGRARVDFVEQVAIGPYTVDFLVRPNIVVECEGIVHSHRQEYDASRASQLETLGYQVWRIPNYSVFADPLGIARMVKTAQRRALEGFVQ